MAQYIQIIGSLGGIDVEKAEVGQIVRVKAVDENGNPTEWEAVDMPEGKVKTVNNIEADRDGNITIPSEVVASEVPPENTSALWVDLSDNEEDTPPSGTSIPPEQLEQIEKNKRDIEVLKNFKESDPTVPEWAKQPEKPTYTADEVGAQLKDFIVNITFNGEEYEADASFSEIGEKFASGVSVYAVFNGRKYELLEFWDDEQASFYYRVTNSLYYRALFMDYTGYIWEGDGQLIDNYVSQVNGKTGWVNLTASDVGAQPKSLVVTITNDENGNYISSHSAKEINAHVSAGGDVFTIHDGLMYRNDGGDDSAWYFVSMLSHAHGEIVTEYAYVLDTKIVEFYSFTTTDGHPVQSVNGKTGEVKLTASDVGALPDTTKIPTVPTKLSAFTNDSGYQTAEQVTTAINTALGVIENGTY